MGRRRRRWGLLQVSWARWHGRAAAGAGGRARREGVAGGGTTEAPQGAQAEPPQGPGYRASFAAACPRAPPGRRCERGALSRMRSQAKIPRQPRAHVGVAVAHAND